MLRDTVELTHQHKIREFGPHRIAAMSALNK
jgi:hypothetical protein